MNLTGNFGNEKENCAKSGCRMFLHALCPGIEPSCQAYRHLEMLVSYTYLIDPDGPLNDNDEKVLPFPAHCDMDERLSMGVTVIQATVLRVSN